MMTYITNLFRRIFGQKAKNQENLNVLISHLEQCRWVPAETKVENDKSFNMNHVVFPKGVYNARPQNGDWRGTPSCIAGHVCALFGNGKRGRNSLQRLADVIGVPLLVAHRIMTGKFSKRPMKEITPEEALAYLRTFKELQWNAIIGK